ncbi:MAG TPA: hypothetical protein PLQ65_13665, partial [Flavihumibacter sp.]|nr:hypothetical protein [Flavihumibacter sp.]
DNAGFGATWAGPIASLLMEKYLNDTLRTERLKEVERVASANLMPGWLVREQFKADSIRAYNWFRQTRDTSVIKKFLKPGQVPVIEPPAPKPAPKPDSSQLKKGTAPDSLKKKLPVDVRTTRLHPEAILPKRYSIKAA